MGDLQRKRRHIASLKSRKGKEVDIQLYISYYFKLMKRGKPNDFC
jgi:hypothetical protein